MIILEIIWGLLQALVAPIAAVFVIFGFAFVK